MELILALRQRLLQERRKCRLHLVTAGVSLLSGHCQMAQSLCQTASSNGVSRFISLEG